MTIVPMPMKDTGISSQADAERESELDSDDIETSNFVLFPPPQSGAAVEREFGIRWARLRFTEKKDNPRSDACRFSLLTPLTLIDNTV